MKGAASLKAEDYCKVSHAASTDPLQTRWRFAPGGNGLLTGRLASTSFRPWEQAALCRPFDFKKSLPPSHFRSWGQPNPKVVVRFGDLVSLF
jgi:hypothetical protein